MRRARPLLATGFAALLAACATPTATPDTLDAPPLVDGRYSTHVARGTFAAPPDELRAWIDADHRFLYSLPDTADVARPVDFDMLAGTWPQAGAVRRLRFSDGSTAMERVVDSDLPARFTYQVWDFTSDTGRDIEYILGRQELSANADGGSDLTWTYQLRANDPAKKPMVDAFVASNVSVLLDSSVANVERQAAAAFGAP